LTWLDSQGDRALGKNCFHESCLMAFLIDVSDWGRARRCAELFELPDLSYGYIVELRPLKT
jgi:hypothetical protein